MLVSHACPVGWHHVCSGAAGEKCAIVIPLEAKVQCDRANATAEAKEKIATASTSNNLKMLNEGLEMLIQVGVEFV